MSDKTWKRHERAVAGMLDTRRTPLSGGNSMHGTTSDTLHDSIYCEAKYRARFSVCSLWKEVQKAATKEKKLPCLALKEKGQRGFLFVIHADDIQEFCRIMTDGR